MATKESVFQLELPLDASAVSARGTAGAVKIAAVTATGKVVASVIVKLDAKGQGLGKLSVPASAGVTRVMVGGADVADAALPMLDTLYANLPARRATALSTLVKLPLIRISDFYWQRWLHWCRNFTVSGRLVCADGSPIPGAVVNAFDVDAFWWWTSYQPLGQATTNTNGEFTIQFRWCCNLTPWWWWRLRDWSLDPDLVRRLGKYLQARPEWPVPPRPEPLPNLNIFGPVVNPRPGPVVSPVLNPALVRPLASTVIEPSQLDSVRTSLLQRLPEQRDATLLNVWPWMPFAPWNDCSPDLVFRATQSCGGEHKLIVNESRAQARWNIATNTHVTLVANDQACCVADPPRPDDDCGIPLGVCGVLGSSIGGNAGAPATPAGYYAPGTADKPFGGTLVIEGDVGADYYALQATQTPGDASSWENIPALSAGGFVRYYWDAVPVPPATEGRYVPVSFVPENIDGKWVMESRAHYEDTHFPGDWGTHHNHIWFTPNLTSLQHWQTEGIVNDGTWALRLLGYTRTGNSLTNERVIHVCNANPQATPRDLQLTVTLDNRQPGSVAQEPLADIVTVNIAGVPKGACSVSTVGLNDEVVIDFAAYDVDGHLDSFDLRATWGEGLVSGSLTALPGATLTPMAFPGVPAADAVGPSYADARSQGAAVPKWRGGGLRLTIPHASQVFPEPCCYQIELHVYTRPIVSCDFGDPHRAFTFYSLSIQHA